MKPTVQHCGKCGKRGKALSYCTLCGWFIPITLAVNPKVVTVTAKCIGCGATRKIRAGEVAPGDMPMCECGNLMIATKAEAR